MALLNILLRSIIAFIDKEDMLKKMLFSWRGVRSLPKLPINETIFSKNTDTSLQKQLEIKLNEYRLVDDSQNEVNIAAFFCNIWRKIYEKNQNNSNSAGWRPINKQEELLVLIYQILKRMNFARNMKLGVDDQITILDIENFIKFKVSFTYLN